MLLGNTFSWPFWSYTKLFLLFVNNYGWNTDTGVVFMEMFSAGNKGCGVLLSVLSSLT